MPLPDTPPPENKARLTRWAQREHKINIGEALYQNNDNRRDYWGELKHSSGQRRFSGGPLASEGDIFDISHSRGNPETSAQIGCAIQLNHLFFGGVNQ